jgi:PAS domain S-box-containing protein
MQWMSSTAQDSAASPRLVHASQLFARVAAALAMGIGAAVLIGWAAHMEWLKSGVLGLVPTMPNTALDLIVTGAALGLSSCRAPRWRRAAKVLALAGAGFAVATLAQDVLGRDLGIDTLLFDIRPARPAEAASVAVLFVDVALLVLDVRTGWPVKPAEILATATAALGWLALGGVLLGAMQFYAGSRYPHAGGVGLPTSVGLILAALGTVAVRPESGAMATFTSRHLGGRIARRMLLVTLSIPALGYAAVAAQRAGLYQPPGAALVEGVAGMVVSLVITLGVSKTLDRADVGRRRVEAQRRVLSALVDNSSDFIGIAEPDGTPVYVNPAGRRMVGLALTRSVEDTQIPEYYPPDVRSFASDVIVKAMVEQGHWQGETYFRNWITQERIPVSDTHFMIRDPERGDVLGMGTITRDISELKKAREEIAEANRRLERAEATFRGIIAIAADAIVSIDDDQRITVFNEGAERIFGWSRDEVLSRPLDVLLPERFRELHRHYVRAFGEGSVSARHVGDGRPPIAGLRKNGEEFPAEATISKLDVAGTRLYTVVLRDITERRRAEEEQKLLAEAGTTLGSTLDPREILVHVARLAVGHMAKLCVAELFEEGGLRAALRACTSDSAKQALCERIESHPGLAGGLLESKRAALVPSIPSGFVESVTSDAELREAVGAFDLRSAMAVPIVAGDRMLGAIFFGCSRPLRAYGQRDLVAAEELARRAAFALENARLYEMSQTATRARDNVLGVVAHDLRNPASTIVMQTDLIRRQADNPERLRTGAGAIERAAHRMQRLIQDLLDVRRLESEGLPLECGPTAVDGVVRDAVEMVRGASARASLAVEVDVGEKLPDVWADRDRLLQVLENLLGNAIKFTGRGGRVVVGATAHGHEILFRVADSGRGIEPSQIAHLFEPFWQAKKGEHQGAGLGLAIVKGIVESHRGRLWVDSTPKVGSTFFFTIPTTAQTESRPTDGARGDRKDGARTQSASSRPR